MRTVIEDAAMTCHTAIRRRLCLQCYRSQLPRCWNGMKRESVAARSAAATRRYRRNAGFLYRLGSIKRPRILSEHDSGGSEANVTFSGCAGTQGCLSTLVIEAPQIQ